MTIQEKLETYAQACDLMLSIPSFGWPVKSLCHQVSNQTDKSSGLKTTQAWYMQDKNWTVIVMESWDEDGQRKSTKITHQKLSCAQAASYFGEN